MKRIFKEEWIIIVGNLICIGIILSTNSGIQIFSVAKAYFGFFSFYLSILFVGTRFLLIISSFESLSDFFRPNSLNRSRILFKDVAIARGLVWLTITLSVYTNLKVRLPLVGRPYFDSTFSEIDDIIFGDFLVDNVINITRQYEWLKFILDQVYVSGFVFFVGLIFLIYIKGKSKDFRILFNAYSLTYLFGISMAAFYPTLGPVFLEPEQFDFLQGTDVRGAQMALYSFMQESIQQNASGGTIQTRAFMGIAAYPSLHVAHMVVITMVSKHVCKFYFYFMIVVTILTYVATIGFGWHYAIDGPVGALLAFACTEAINRTLKDCTLFSKSLENKCKLPLINL